MGKDAAFAAAADGDDDDVDEEIAALLLVCTMWAYYCLSKCIHAYATTTVVNKHERKYRYTIFRLCRPTIYKKKFRCIVFCSALFLCVVSCSFYNVWSC